MLPTTTSTARQFYLAGLFTQHGKSIRVQSLTLLANYPLTSTEADKILNNVIVNSTDLPPAVTVYAMAEAQ